MKKKKISDDRSDQLRTLRRRVSELEAIHAEHEQAEEALRKSEERYRAIFAAAENVSLITTDLAGREALITEFSPGAERIFRYKRDEIVGKPLAMLHRPEDVARFPKVIDTIARTKTGLSKETRLVRKGGEEFPALLSVYPIFDAQGNITSVLGVAVDIAEQKQAEDALRGSEERFRKLFEHSNDAIFIHTLDGQILDANGRACEMLEYDKEQLLSMRVEALHPEAERAASRAALASTVQTGSVRFETQFQRADGSTLDVEISSRITDAEKRIAQGVVRDMTQHNRAEEELRVFKTICEKANYGAAIADLEGNLAYSNQAFAEMHGYAPEELVRRHLSVCHTPEQMPAVNRLNERLKREGSYAAEEIWHKRRDGSVFPTLMTATLIRDERGKPVFLSGTAIEISDRKRAQEQLRESEARYRALVERIPAVVYAAKLDEASTTMFISPQVESFLGYTPEEYSQDPDIWRKRLHPDDRARVMEELARSHATHEKFVCEYRMIAKDRREVWFRDEASTVYDAQGTPTLLQGIMCDITDRKRAEAALQESEARFRNLVDNLPVGIYRTTPGPRGNFIMANRAMARIHGYPSVEELVKTEVAEMYVDPAQREAFSKRLTEQGQAVMQELHLRRRDGTVIWGAVTAQVVRNEQGEVEAFDGVLEDITERKQAEEALRESEHLLGLILKHSRDGLNITETDMETDRRRQVLCNDRYVEMSGRSREELMGAEDLREFLINRTPPELARENHERLLKGLPTRGMASWIRPDGKENWYEWTAAPFTEGGKNYLVGIDRDITERMRNERAIREAHRKLTTAREEERRRLAAELHDSIGQGLIALQLALRNIQNMYLSRHGADERAEVITRPCQQCDELIREVRNLCRGLYPTTLELGLAAALGELARDFQGRTQVTVRDDVPQEAGRFPGDVEIALFRVAQEGLVNAVRHAQAKNILLALAYEDGQVVLTVSDDGIGFDPAGVVGKGLGLSMMQERLQAVGGELTIGSGPEGTQVRAAVPTGLVRPEGQAD